MSAELQHSAVNEHYLDKVLDLAEDMEVAATEDIFDSRGMKLIAKGARISRALQEKLILHKLRKPLESSIAVADGVDVGTIVAEAQRISESIDPITCLLRASSNGRSPFDVLKQVRLGSAMSMMLTIIERGGPEALEHSVMVSLLSISLAKSMHLSENDLHVAALAGLLHDIGELYIEPAYLKRSSRLLPHEWRHVVVHPRIGQMLIAELDEYPASVANAVSEHHERINGTGYPRQIGGDEISRVGLAVAVTETISGIFKKRDRPLERAELALKIIPGEHARGLVATLTEVLRQPHQTGAGEAELPTEHARQAVQQLYTRLSNILGMGAGMMASPALERNGGKRLLQHALDRLQVIQRAFTSTGLDYSVLGEHGMFERPNDVIVFEAEVAGQEILWRMREVARDLSLHASSLTQAETELFQPLIGLLDAEN